MTAKHFPNKMSTYITSHGGDLGRRRPAALFGCVTIIVGILAFSAQSFGADSATPQSAWPELTQVYVVLHYKYWCGTPPGWVVVLQI